MIKNTFYLILKVLFVPKIFKNLSWLFGHAEKMALLERYVSYQNLWHHNLVNKQLQYTYWLTSHEIKITAQICQLIEYLSVNRIFFFKNHAENEAVRCFRKSSGTSFSFLCMIFQENNFSCYIFLTDKILLSDCLYLRYWGIYVLELLVSHVVTS